MAISDLYPSINLPGGQDVLEQRKKNLKIKTTGPVNIQEPAPIGPPKPTGNVDLGPDGIQRELDRQTLQDAPIQDKYPSALPGGASVGTGATAQPAAADRSYTLPQLGTPAAPTDTQQTGQEDVFLGTGGGLPDQGVGSLAGPGASTVGGTQQTTAGGISRVGGAAFSVAQPRPGVVSGGATGSVQPKQASQMAGPGGGSGDNFVPDPQGVSAVGFNLAPIEQQVKVGNELVSVPLVDPNEYNESVAQQTARQGIYDMQAEVGAGRIAPQVSGATQLGGDYVGQGVALQGRTEVGPMAGFDAAQVEGTTLARDDLAQRADQLSQTDRLTGLATGTGPSLVESQLQQGMEQGLAARMAAEAASRGSTNVGGSRRSLAQAQGVAAADVAGRAAELGIKERLGAEQQLTGALQGARAQDIQAATSQAQLSAAERQQQANLSQQASSFYADALNKGTLTQAEFDSKKQEADQRALNDFNAMNLDRDTKFQVVNLDTESRINLANMSAQLTVLGMDDAMKQQLLALEIQQANALKAQGITYDQNRVADLLNQASLIAGHSAAQQTSGIGAGIGAILGGGIGGLAGGVAGAGAGAGIGSTLGETIERNI